ncbi:response regulator transcription factor [Sorangium sp. So ce124]|uniref:response regulator transcription factor n=1 Tax=Sorangium sp. So ce124 TaxID=3133280 RepID=UPI003F5F722C
MPSEARSLLVVDDDDTYRARLVRAFARRGFGAQGAPDADAALAVARAIRLELAVVDLRLPGRSGLDVVRELKAIDPRTSVVVLTGYGSIATALEAVRRGATHYVSKPADVDDILAAFARADAPAEPASIEHEVPSLARAEWEHINRVLADCGGNISQAARLLGIQRRSLQRKLAKYPVPR